MQVWAYCRILLFFTWERAEHRLTLRGVNKDQNPTLTKKITVCGHLPGTPPPASCLGGDLTHIRLFDQPTKPRPKWYSFSFINFKIPGLGEKKIDIVSQIMFFSERNPLYHSSGAI